MLLKDFYSVRQRSKPEEEISKTGQTVERYQFTIELNPSHPVYEGHFSGNPVVPGVCQVQMICELLSSVKETAVRLIHADNVKFLTLMVPDKNRIINADILVKKMENGGFSVNATLLMGELTFIKFKGIFIKE